MPPPSARRGPANRRPSHTQPLPSNRISHQVAPDRNYLAGAIAAEQPASIGVAFIETPRGLFRHVGSSRLTPADLPHSGTVARCGEYVTIRRPSTRPRPYDGQRLRIISVNHETFEDSTRRPRPLDYVEVAVEWGSRTLWFRLDELAVTR